MANVHLIGINGDKSNAENEETSATSTSHPTYTQMNNHPTREAYWFAHSNSNDSTPTNVKPDSTPANELRDQQLQRDREERIRQFRAQQEEGRLKKLRDLENQFLQAQKLREQQEDERRKRIEEAKVRESDRRQQVEERKRQIWEAEQERKEAILRRNMEREARIEARRNAQRNSQCFAFGSSTPRTFDLDLAAIGVGRNSVLMSSVSGRRSEERDIPPPRSTSACSVDRKFDEICMSRSMQSLSSATFRGRRRTDIIPALSRERSITPHSAASATTSRGNPSRAVSMTRLDQLAQPRRTFRPVAAPAPTGPTTAAPSMSKSMFNLALQQARPRVMPRPGGKALTPSPGGGGGGMRAAQSMCHLAVVPRLTRTARLRQEASSLRAASAWNVNDSCQSGWLLSAGKDHSQSPSRPHSAMSGTSDISTTTSSCSISGVHMRTRPPTRRPRPYSVHGTAVGEGTRPERLARDRSVSQSVNKPERAKSATREVGEVNTPRPLSATKKPVPPPKPESLSRTKSHPVVPVKDNLRKVPKTPTEENTKPISEKTSVEEKNKLVSKKTSVEEKSKPVSEKTSVEEKNKPVSKKPSVEQKTKPASEKTSVEEKSKPVSEKLLPQEETKPVSEKTLGRQETKPPPEKTPLPVKAESENPPKSDIKNFQQEHKIPVKPSDLEPSSNAVAPPKAADGPIPPEKTQTSETIAQSSVQPGGNADEELLASCLLKLSMEETFAQDIPSEVAESGNAPMPAKIETEIEVAKDSAPKLRITSEEEARTALAEKRRLAREQAEKQAELERQRLEEIRRKEEEQRRAEEEEQRRMEEEQMRLAELHRQLEEEKLRKAIEEQQQREREEQEKREEEARQKAEREEQERKAREEAEKQRLELEEKLRKEEEERAERKRRVEQIMARTRGKAAQASSGGSQGDTMANMSKSFSAASSSPNPFEEHKGGGDSLSTSNGIKPSASFNGSVQMSSSVNWSSSATSPDLLLGSESDEVVSRSNGVNGKVDGSYDFSVPSSNGTLSAIDAGSPQTNGYSSHEEMSCTTSPEENTGMDILIDIQSAPQKTSLISPQNDYRLVDLEPSSLDNSFLIETATEVNSNLFGNANPFVAFEDSLQKKQDVPVADLLS